MAVKSDKVITNCLLDILEISLLATGENKIGASKILENLGVTYIFVEILDFSVLFLVKLLLL